MEAEFFGANCIRLRTKKATVIVDDFASEKGKTVAKPEDIAIFTKKQESPSAGGFVIDIPGEYEVNNVSIQGISARAHIDTPEEKTANIYRLILNDFRVAVIGHIYPDLSEEQLEAIGMVDVLFVPVGGNGYTLDPVGALKVIRKIGPSIVVPTHYDDKKIKYEVPQVTLEEARKVLSMEPAEELDQLKLKGREFSDGTKMIILKNQL